MEIEGLVGECTPKEAGVGSDQGKAMIRRGAVRAVLTKAADRNSVRGSGLIGRPAVLVSDGALLESRKEVGS
jgi:hypothetical protein